MIELYYIKDKYKQNTHFIVLKSKLKDFLKDLYDYEIKNHYDIKELKVDDWIEL